MSLSNIKVNNSTVINIDKELSYDKNNGDLLNNSALLDYFNKEEEQIKKYYFNLLPNKSYNKYINIENGHMYHCQNLSDYKVDFNFYDKDSQAVQLLGFLSPHTETVVQCNVDDAAYLSVYLTNSVSDAGGEFIFSDITDGYNSLNNRYLIDQRKYAFKQGFIVTEYDNIPDYIGKWYDGRSGSIYSIFIPVKENEQFILKNNDGKIHNYAFFSSKIVGNTGDEPQYAENFNTYFLINAHTEELITIPENVNYLMFANYVGINSFYDIFKIQAQNEKNYPKLDDVFEFSVGNDYSYYNQKRNYITLVVPNLENEQVDNVLALQNKSNYGHAANCAINFLDSAGTEKCAIGYSHNSTIDGMNGYYPNTLYFEIGNAFSSDRNSDVNIKFITTRNGMSPRQAVLLEIKADGNIDLYPAACGTEGAKVTIHGDLYVTGQIIND